VAGAIVTAASGVSVRIVVSAVDVLSVQAVIAASARSVPRLRSTRRRLWLKAETTSTMTTMWMARTRRAMRSRRPTASLPKLLWQRAESVLLLSAVDGGVAAASRAHRLAVVQPPRAAPSNS
jgi:hypothetical protein